MPFIPRTREIEVDRFKSSLVYRLGSRTARATRRNPVSKHQNSKQTKEPFLLREARKDRK